MKNVKKLYNFGVEYVTISHDEVRTYKWKINNAFLKKNL